MLIELKREGVKNRQYDLEIVPMRYNCAGKNPSLYQSHRSCQSSSFDLDVNPVPPGPQSSSQMPLVNQQVELVALAPLT